MVGYFQVGQSKSDLHFCPDVYEASDLIFFFKSRQNRSSAVLKADFINTQSVKLWKHIFEFVIELILNANFFGVE